ncbi:MAG: hypothetical protein KIS76_11890 [Pyrinomonadaceae bacterium]|nr:hypothetical protein [Pyrinomonadaceae bacterium]
MTNYEAPKAEIGKIQTVALGIGGIVSLVVLAAALFFPDYREQALRGWLVGFVFWGGIGFGGLGIIMLQYLTGGAWGVVIRRIVEAASRTIPWLFILFIPIIIAVYTGNLYAWTRVDLITDELVKHAIEHRGAYQTPFWWIVRTLIYFAIFGVMTFLLNNWSARQDAAKDFDEAAGYLGTATAFSGPTMVFYVLTVTFATVDWVMSLDAGWFSTIWGLLFVASWALTAFCFSIIVLSFLYDKPPMDKVLGKRHFHDIGKLVLALVMVWAYFNFSQYLIIWSGNLPEETQWYLTRMTGGWGIVGVILIVFHFALPFLILLSREVKRKPKMLALVAGFILIMRISDVFYLIEPSPMVGEAHNTAGFHITLFDILAPIGIGGLFIWRFFVELQKRPLVPVMDPFLENAIEHGKGH